MAAAPRPGDRAAVGASSLGQLDEALDALDIVLDTDTVGRLDAA
ncbi:MAG TPA: hypothetical protein VGN37_14590 [Actinocatenispora sp.]